MSVSRVVLHQALRAQAGAHRRPSDPSQPSKEGRCSPGHTCISSESWVPFGNWTFWHDLAGAYGMWLIWRKRANSVSRISSRLDFLDSDFVCDQHEGCGEKLRCLGISGLFSRTWQLQLIPEENFPSLLPQPSELGDLSQPHDC